MSRQTPTRVAALAAALLAAAPAARADEVPGDASTRARISLGFENGVGGALEAPGDVDWFRVRLVRGQDYGVRVADEFHPAQVTLRDPRGRAIRTVLAGSITDQGFEHRAAVTGDHFVEVRFRPDAGGGLAASYGIKVATDCRDAPTTKCSLRLGRPYNGRTLWGYDRDRFALTLDRSRRYSFALTTPPALIGVSLEVIDGRGRVLARAADDGNDGQPEAVVRGFWPPTSGRFYLRVGVAGDLGNAYALLATLD